MNAVVQFTGAAPAVPNFSMSDMEHIANAIAKGGMFGSKDPYAVLTLCMLAQAEGKHPAIVFRDYDLIQGKPAKKAQAMQTDFLAAGGKIEWHQLDDGCADATFSHPQGGTARIQWDTKRASAAGLAGKDMWKKFPRQMLRARVISEGVRTIYPGATSGLYETTEVQDFTPAPAVHLASQNETLTPFVQEDAEPARAKPVKLTNGPHTSKTALWTAYKGFVSELNGCGDADELEGFLATDDAKVLQSQILLDAPTLAHGGDTMPEEFEPMLTLIARLRTELSADRITDAMIEAAQ